MLDWDKVQKMYNLDLNFIRETAKINRIGFEEFVNDNLPNLPNIVQETTSERDSLVAFHQSYFCPVSACLNEAVSGGCLSTLDSLVSSQGSISDDFNINRVAISKKRRNKKLLNLYNRTKETIEGNWPRLQNDKKYILDSVRRCRAAAPQLSVLLGKRGRHHNEIENEKDFIESHKLSKTIKPVTNFSELISAYSDNCDGRYISLMKHSLTCYKNTCNNPSLQVPMDNSIRYFPPPVPVTYIHPACWGMNNRMPYDSRNIAMIHPASMSSTEVSTNISYRSKYYTDVISPRTSRSNELNAADGIEDWDDLNITLIQATAELHLIQAANYCLLRKLLGILEIAEGPGKQDLKKRKNSLILKLSNSVNPSGDEDKSYEHLVGKHGRYTHLLGALRVSQIPHGNFINTLKVGDSVDALLPVTRVPTTSIRSIYMKKKMEEYILSIEKKWCSSIVVEILEDKPVKAGRGGMEGGTDGEHSSPASGCSISLPVERRVRRYIKVRVSPTNPTSTDSTHDAHWIGVEDQCLAPLHTYTEQLTGYSSSSNNNNNSSSSNIKSNSSSNNNSNSSSSGNTSNSNSNSNNSRNNYNSNNKKI